MKRLFSAAQNPFKTQCLKQLQLGSRTLEYFSLPHLQDSRLERLPYSIRVLLESALRNCDEFQVKSADVEKILGWEQNSQNQIEIPFKPARVILQDFTGVPAVVDLAAMRSAVQRLGVDANKINPICPVDLVIDHSVQVDASRSPEALAKNEELEFSRNHERFQFLKWGQKAFSNMKIVPPGSGIVHQVNLEYLARGVFETQGLLYPDSLVGTDSHTTMINGAGIIGWGVGGIEAEAVMLGQPISMVLPEVIGFKMTGKLNQHVTATDLVLTVTRTLRSLGVVGKFVEFYGPGLDSLSIADRATISNMSPEYGATIGFFPMDHQTLRYFKDTGRGQEKLQVMEEYLKRQEFFRSDDVPYPNYTKQLELDLSSVEPCLSGPKRPHDRVSLSDMKTDFNKCLGAPNGFKGFGINNPKATKSFQYNGHDYTIKHGSVVIASITSCTNTSNPDVLVGAGILAKNAVKAGLNVLPYIKTSLSPGSGVVNKYLVKSGLLEYLEKLGFYTAGFGCMTCIGNSGDLDQPVADAINSENLIASAVLSGNRNFEGRVNPLTQANYLASPMLVVAYALAGTVDIDFDKEPIGISGGKEVFLRDIWPSRQQIQEVVGNALNPDMFTDVYSKIAQGTDRWNALQSGDSEIYSFDEDSTYIHEPPFFKNLSLTLPEISNISQAHVLLNLGDSVTTDHISPAGKISNKSPAARYLMSRGVKPVDFNSYGSRRGNDEIMARGTFANIRLINKLMENPGPQTIHFPTGDELDIFDAADRYMSENRQLIILAGKEYGSGSSRDWAAKGTYMLGVKAVIAESYERIHRSNLVGMGIIPLQFTNGENADSLGLKGDELFDIDLKGGNLGVQENLNVRTSSGKSFLVTARLDTELELEYFRNGGILNYVLRNLAQSS